MIQVMRHQLATLLAAGVFTLAVPCATMAQDEDKTYDARLEGHDPSATLEKSGTALTYILLSGLGILCVGVMFRNAKRTHLD